MINALLAIGLSRRSERLIKRFLTLQTPTGYFRSQEGEWDSNGQVLWIADRLQSLSGCLFGGSQIKSFIKGARWIEKKRMKRQGSTRCRGLLPAGFSAKHLGPNDYYFWDNFWGLAGFRAAAQIAKRTGLGPEQKEMEKNTTRFEKDIFDSIAQIPDRMKNGAVPASPYRRMDAGAVGSLVADYPLQITEAGDPRIMKTVSYRMENCFYSGAFFQGRRKNGSSSGLTSSLAGLKAVNCSCSYL